MAITDIDEQLTKDFKVAVSNQLENETYQEGVMLPLSLTVYEKSLTTEETKTSESKETEETNSTKEKGKETETETSTSDSSLTKRNSENLPKTGEKKAVFVMFGLLTLASGFLLFRKQL
ncbi:LPXTG cell wall anchor domain-containing protein [Vagococcus fluvialis]|uniref:LPXTG cell wall anchor domain-containing protein n=1 Tax=Vagococcus fluvialis TaxID=2738 RepID=UPI003B591A62